jgi:hypothetical protein
VQTFSFIRPVATLCQHWQVTLWEKPMCSRLVTTVCRLGKWWHVVADIMSDSVHCVRLAALTYTAARVLNNCKFYTTLHCCYNCTIYSISFNISPRQRQRIFPVVSASRPALGPSQPPVQCVPGVLSGGGGG